MKRLLITGGSGLVGGHICNQAANQWEVYATYHSNPFEMDGVSSIYCELRDEKNINKILEEIQPHVIIHCAAWSHIDGCEQSPNIADQINVQATEYLANYCHTNNSRLIFLSSDMVFDGKNGNYNEKDIVNPINYYGKTKVRSEQLILSFCSNFVIVRVALVYGKSITGGSSFSDKVIQQISQGQKMFLFIDQYRSPILVQELAMSLLEIAEMTWTGLIHLGGSERVDRYTFGLRLAELKQFPKEMLQPGSMNDVRFVGPRPKDVSLNIQKAKLILKNRLSGYYDGLAKAYGN